MIVNLTAHSPVRSRGLTLIEVLVALLVLSIGLVGIAALHLTSLKNAHSSYYTSIASSIALDFEERLWLRAAERGSSTCIDGSDVNQVVGDLMGIWAGPGNGDAVVLPNLRISTGDISNPPGQDSWVDVPLAVRWTEGRFDDLGVDDDGGFEQYNYQARVVCHLADPDDDNDEET